MPGVVYNGLSSDEIKRQAMETVDREASGASVPALLSSARSQLALGSEYEAKGELGSAYAAYTKTADLTRKAMARADSGPKDPVMKREILLFMQNNKDHLGARSKALQQTLDKMYTQNDKPKPLPSIAERMRALEGQGMKISPASAASSTSKQHAFVPPADLGPPSPTDTKKSSLPDDARRKPLVDITHLPSASEFASQFPSLDDFDKGLQTNIFPSVPINIPSTPSASASASAAAPSPPIASNASPTARRFALGNSIERPGSTPMPPSSSFTSRPTSPAAPSRKPSKLIPNQNAATPRELRKFMRDHTVLLVDLRHRQQFDLGHIKYSSIVCVEPTVLAREGITAEKIEEALVVGPSQESTMFSNRDKFDILAFYDEDSATFGDKSSPANTLVRVVHEQAFRKSLKRVPMLLVGGFQAWTNTWGPAEVERSSGFVPYTPEPRSPGIPIPLSPSPSMTNGFSGVSSASASAYVAPPPPVPSDPHQLWAPRSTNTIPSAPSLPGHRPNYSLDQYSHSRSPAEFSPTLNGVSSPTRLGRPPSQSPIVNGTASVAFPSFQMPRSNSSTSTSTLTTISPPPLASINPSSLTRRRSDFIDQSQDALAYASTSSSSSHPTHQSYGSMSSSSFAPSGSPSQRLPIDYPDLLPSSSTPQPPPSGPQILRPPPPAAPPSLERQRSSVPHSQPPSSYPYSSTHPSSSNHALAEPVQPRIGTSYPVTYWSSSDGTGLVRTGLKNLGNTCYMNATVQCLSASLPVVRFFTETRWEKGINLLNKMGTKGALTGGFAKLLGDMVRTDIRFLSPNDFRKTIANIRSEYSGSDQHDSQEFLSFLLDGIHEDMNRVLEKQTMNKTPAEEEELERLPVNIASAREWQLWKRRNDSIIVDYFQGQFRNRLECMVCGKSSTTYNAFSILQLPIPSSSRSSQKIPLQSCLDALFNTEILEKDDAWDCPQCKTKVRAKKQLSLARLPPILLIHLKRFETHGRFSDKIDSFVDFPMKGLDLTGFMPKSVGGGTGGGVNGTTNGPSVEHVNTDDPRAQIPPYKYDLYAVTNHYGNLSSGHYTAYIQSRDKWMYCDDSSVKEGDPAQVVGQKAYVLFYKRTRFY